MSLLLSGKNTNSRLYRNCLYENDNNNESTSATSGENVNSIISCDSERDSTTDALHKKAMKRLIDVSSPTNESKRVLFHQLVKNEATTKEVIAIAVEMGSSVIDTKITYEQLSINNISNTYIN